MKRIVWRVLKWGGLVSLGLFVVAVSVWAHATGVLVNQDFVDGTTVKGSVRYNGQNTAGQKWFGLASYGADFLAFWTTTAQSIVFYVNNTEMLTLAPGGTITLFNGGGTGSVVIDGTASRALYMAAAPTTGVNGSEFFTYSGAANAGSTDKDGGAYSLFAGAPTGTGRSNVYIDGYVTATSSGSGWGARIHKEIYNGFKSLTDAADAAIVSMALASNTVVAGQLAYSIEVWDGTDVQVEEGVLTCHATNKAGAVANNTCVKFGNQQAMTSGTLTVTGTITAANPAVVTVNSNSSLTPTYTKLGYTFKNLTHQQISVQ